jgi:hypothetical protein
MRKGYDIKEKEEMVLKKGMNDTKIGVEDE